MKTMPIGFGVSIGDFIALFELTCKIINALSDVRGSSQHYKSLLEILTSYQNAVAEVTTFALAIAKTNPRAIAAESGSTANSSYASIINGLLHEKQKVVKYMEEFLIASHKYTEALVHGNGSKIKKTLRKMSYAFRDADVSRLDERLRVHFTLFQTYSYMLGWRVLNQSSAENVSAQAQIQKDTDALKSMQLDASNKLDVLSGNQSDVSVKIDEIKTSIQSSHLTGKSTLLRVDSNVCEILSRLWSIEQNFPKELGYPWEGAWSGADAPIRFENALGQRFHVPLYLCSDFQMFRDVLEIAHRNLPGHKKVTYGDYVLSSNRGIASIEDSNWHQVIKPGMRMFMELIVRVFGPLQKAACPKCKSNMLQGSSIITRNICQRCGLKFTILEKVEEIQLSDSMQLWRPKRRPLPLFNGVRGGCLAKYGRFETIHEHPRRQSRKEMQRGSLKEEEHFTSVRYISVDTKILKKQVVSNEEIYDIPRNSLHGMAMRGDLMALSNALDGVEDIDCFLNVAGIYQSTPDQLTPLYLASEYGKFEVVELLLSAGANPATVNKRYSHYKGSEAYLTWSNTAPDIACEKGHGQIAKLLISKISDIQGLPRNAYAWTALQEASHSGLISVTELLLDRGADVNAPPAHNTGRTALQAAVCAGEVEIVELLLQRGAEVNAPCAVASGITALQGACRIGHVRLVQRLLDLGADVNMPSCWDGGGTALQNACRYGHDTIVDLILKHGADVNHPPSAASGMTALQAASMRGNLTLLNHLLEQGAHVNADPGESLGFTALQLASFHGHIEAVRMLLRYNADVSARACRYFGRTALQAACEKGYEEIVRLILVHGADINESPSPFGGQTALQAACRGGHLDIVDFLIHKGADVNAPGSQQVGYSAVQSASATGHLSVVERLFELGANLNGLVGIISESALEAAAKRNNTAVVRFLLDHGANVNALTWDGGESILTSARKTSNGDVVNLLLERGAKDFKLHSNDMWDSMHLP